MDKTSIGVLSGAAILIAVLIGLIIYSAVEAHRSQKFLACVTEHPGHCYEAIYGR